MTHVVEARRVEPVPIAAVRRRAGLADLSRVIPEACGEAWAATKAAGLGPAGRMVAVYLDEAIHIEVGVEVPGPFPGDDRLFPSATPGGLVATTTHLGPYERRHEAHAAVRAWCADRGLPLAGPNWEVYGHAEEDPSRQRTDVVYLLA